MKKEEKTVQFFVTKTFCFALFFFFRNKHTALIYFYVKINRNAQMKIIEAKTSTAKKTVNVKEKHVLKAGRQKLASAVWVRLA